MPSMTQALFNDTYGRLAFGSITGTYATLKAVTTVTGSVTGNKGSAGILEFFNTLNQDVIISLDGGTTDAIYLPAGLSYTIDLFANFLEFVGTIQVKHAGVAPTSGGISVTIIRSRM